MMLRNLTHVALGAEKSIYHCRLGAAAPNKLKAICAVIQI